MKKIVLLFCCCYLTSQVFAQTQYQPTDSLRIVSLLDQAKGESKEVRDQMLFFGKAFLGTPYVAGTLDKNITEQLVVDTQQQDCTTFVETVLALTVVSGTKSAGFDDFTEALKAIRYRAGEVEGYASRLHYFSDWIVSNSKKNTIIDISDIKGIKHSYLNLHFMSSHPDKYAMLGTDSIMINRIKEQEKQLNGRQITYLPKAELNKPIYWIQEGDIIAFVTSIGGLDISHVGIAIKQGKKLHLLHASSEKKEVIIDSQSLFEQLKSSPKVLGIRVIRANRVTN